MSTIGGNFTFATAGSEDVTYSFTYATLKSAASESTDTDAFRINSVLANGQLYYNTGSVTTPSLVEITSAYAAVHNIQVRITGIFIDGVKVSTSDAKLYWAPTGNVYDAAGVQAFTVKAVDNADGIFDNDNDSSSGDTAIASIKLAAVNDAPVIDSDGGAATAAVSVDENLAAVTTAHATDADIDGAGTDDTLTYSISGGADAGAFSINAGTGALTFTGAPNFEAPTDADHDGVYVVNVTVTDNSATIAAPGTNNLSDTQTISVTVTNVNENPVNTVTGATWDSAGTLIFDGAGGSGHGAVISIADPDTTTTSISTELWVEAGSLSIGAHAGVAVIAGSGTTASHLTITGTPADVNAALQALTFSRGGAAVSDTTLHMQTSDNGSNLGAALTDTDTVTLTAAAPQVVDVARSGFGYVTQTGVDYYNAGDTISITVTFDQAVTVTGGTPYIPVTLDSGDVNAALVSGSGTTALTFTYTVAGGATDTAGGISIGSINLNGGSIHNAGLAEANLAAYAAPSGANVVVDTTVAAPAALDLVADSDSNINTDNITNDDTPTITGTGEAGATIELYSDADGLIGTTTVAGNGTWSITTGALSEGEHNLAAEQTDVAGNLSAASVPLTITVDTAVAAPVINAVATNDIVNDAEALAGFNITGTGEVGATVTLSFTSGRVLAGGNTAVVDAGGNWSVAVADADVTAFGEGAETITATQTDLAGNTSASDTQAITVDTTAPTATYAAVTYDASNNTLTVTGTNMNTILSGGETSATDVAARLDLTKMSWDFDSNGANTAFNTNGGVASAQVLDDYTMKIVLTNGLATAIEGNANFGTDGTALEDSLVIANGFTGDAAGNVAADDGATATVLGSLNLTGMPQTYSIDFSVLNPEVNNDTLGEGTGGNSVPTFDATAGDTLHIAGVSAADVSVDGSSVANGNGGDLVLIAHDAAVLAGGVDSQNGNSVFVTHTSELDGSSVVIFDDGSKLITNTGAKATLNGGTMADQLISGDLGDRLSGNSGNDLLIGGDGADQLYGGNNNDILFGWGGNDYLNGGSGADIFVTSYNTLDSVAGVNRGIDTVAGFTHGTDKLLLAGATNPDLANVTMVVSGSDMLVLTNGAVAVRVVGGAATFTTDDIVAGDFYVNGNSTI